MKVMLDLNQAPPVLTMKADRRHNPDDVALYLSLTSLHEKADGTHGSGNIFVGMSDDELDTIETAIKAVRKERRRS